MTTPTATPEAGIDYEYVFRRHYVDGVSPSGIGKELHRSYTTIAAVLAGTRDAEATVALRAQHPAYVPPWEQASPFTDAQLARVFAAWHTDKLTLSAVADQVDQSGKPGLIRRVLRGETEAARTVELRAEYPEYRWVRGQTSFTDSQLDDIFAAYHGEHFDGTPYEGGRQSMEQIAARYGAVRGTVANMVHGRKGRVQTQRLVDRYGTDVRPPGWPQRGGDGAVQES